MAGKAGGLDQPSGEVAGRILEGAAKAAHSIRLGALALRLDRVGTCTDAGDVVGRYGEAATNDDVSGEVVLETRIAVAEGGVGARNPAGGAVWRHHLALDQAALHVTPERPGVAPDRGAAAA